MIAGPMLPEAAEVSLEYAGLITAAGFFAAFLLSRLAD
jgi:hypothetical protein